MATPEQIAAWQRLTETAEAWTKAKDDRQARNALHAVAMAYPKAFGATDTKPAPRPVLDGAVFPNYGRSKGMPVAGASVQDLEFYANGCRRSLADESKARWHDKERQLLAAIEAELAGR